MANESTIASRSLLPTYESLYGEEGKFPVDPDTVARLRKEAEEQGLIFSGDATAGEKLSEFIRNAPDAAYSFLARGAEGTAELAAGLALLTYKGGRLATETDPEKLKEIMAEPSFTKYLGEFRGALGDLNLGENRISGLSPEEIAGVIGYYTAPVPTGIMAAGARAVPTLVKGAGQVADELATTARFFPEYNPLRKFQPKSVGAMSIDELIESGQIKKGTDLTQDQGNLLPIKSTRADKIRSVKTTRADKIKETMRSDEFKEATKARMSDKVNKQLNTEGVTKILEDIRTGKTSLKEGSSLLNNILPKQAMFSGNDAGRGFYRLFENYNLTRAGNKDVFDIDVFGYPDQGQPQLIGATRKKDIVDAIEQAENAKTGESFAINFRNIYHNITKGEDQPIQKLSTIQLYDIKEILKAMKKDPDILDIDRPGGVKISNDGTSIYQLPIDQASIDINKSWNAIKTNSLIEGEGATKKLKTTIKANGSDVNFDQVKAQIFKNNVIKSKLDNLKNLFEDLRGESFYSLDHIQPKIFGGSDEINNLRFIMEGPHNSIKKLPAGKTATQESVVKSKSNFEKNVHSMAKEIVKLVKKGELEEAKKISKEINTLQNNFKNTFKNTDFIIGEAYVPIKTGDDTANYIKFSEYLNLNSKQQKQVSDLIPTYKNLPNKNKSLEKGLDDIVEAYQGVSLLFPSGRIPKEYVGQMASMKQGGIAGIDYTTRPLDGTR